VLEINAFGDLLPRMLYAGKSTYKVQIDAVVAQLGMADIACG